MNAFLKHLFDSIAIDVNHLKSYLSPIEINYLNGSIKSQIDFQNEFYSDENGDNLEVLLHFMHVHKNDIISLLKTPKQSEMLIRLYTSSCISGEYNCFRFDLHKFDKTYESKDNLLKLYRVGRIGETSGNLGNSWSTSSSGLKNYCSASSIDTSNRPVFSMVINDSEVLFRGNKQEDELVLKPGFDFINIELLNDHEKRIFFS